MKKTLIVALMMVAGISHAQQDQPKEDFECLTMFDRKILGCNSSQSCKESKPKIEACIVHLEEINEFCKTSEASGQPRLGLCYSDRYRNKQLKEFKYHLPKYPEYITYYEGVEAEKAIKDAELAEKHRIENEKFQAMLNAEQAKEKAAAKRAAAVRAEANRKEKARLASCNPGDPYVGMSERSLNNLCKQARWEGSTDYGSVKYTHYRTGYARVTVRNGVVAIVSY